MTPARCPINTAGYDEILRRRIVERSVVDADGCWSWTGYLTPKGYGQLGAFGRREKAHRVSYRVFVGEFDTALTIDHLCRNRRCVNPSHLEPVPLAENLRRGHRSRPSVTHCIHGHEFTHENTYIRRDGARSCRVCKRAERKQYKARRRQRVAVAA